MLPKYVCVYINRKKTKILSIEKIGMFRLGDDHVKIVESLIFLGSKIDVSGGCEGGINRRLSLGRTAMPGLTKIWKDKDVTIQTKYCCLVAFAPLGTPGW